MLMPTAGSRFYIADHPDDGVFPRAEPVPSDAWVEISETEALGMLGVEWDQESTVLIGSCDNGHPEEVTVKGALRRLPMQVIFGMAPTDPGQVLLWRAARSEDSYPFRLVFADGVTSRQWFALVMSIGEVYDAANSVIRLLATLKPTTATIHSEEG